MSFPTRKVVTALAAVIVLLALIGPDRVTRLTPAAFVRIPVEALLAVALLLILPARPRRWVAGVLGGLLGLLTVMTIVDAGFYAVLDRPFDPVLDWPLFGNGMDYLTMSSGRAAAVGAAVGAVGLAVAILVLMTLSVMRLAEPLVRHRSAAARTVGVLGVAWVVCAVLGAQIVPGLPVASRSEAALVYDHARQVHASLGDQGKFAKALAVDAFRDTPGDQLLTALRGKDVVLAFVESYGRSAVEDPELAEPVDAVLDAGTRQLRAAGFTARSAFLTSPTAGGGSWLAHSTLLSGLWINNQQRYQSFVHSDRFTLTRAFKRAGWRTVAVMPATGRDWPEGKVYGHDKIYDARNLGYQGPPFSLGAEPDQYTLSVFQRREMAAAGRGPLMAEIPLISSHSPWTPVPRMLDWDDIGDGSVYAGMGAEGDPPAVEWRSPGRIRADYRGTIAYTLEALISYVETYGNDNLVLIFLGDHQPAPVVTGEGASRDVPITIIAHDPTVLDRISAWGWQDGLRPHPDAPVWRMDTFRDRFLTAFGPGGHAGG
ncbi:MAG: sulfatase [Micromonosporaceae bacterium]|nr:sulfatase [Micromonosporaceae bacterium]